MAEDPKSGLSENSSSEEINKEILAQNIRLTAQLQAQRERVEKVETRLRTIANISAVIQPGEKCQEILVQIHNIAELDKQVEE